MKAMPYAKCKRMVVRCVKGEEVTCEAIHGGSEVVEND